MTDLLGKRGDKLEADFYAGRVRPTKESPTDIKPSPLPDSVSRPRVGCVTLPGYAGSGRGKGEYNAP